MSKGYTHEKIKVPRFSEAEGFYTTEKKSKQMAKIKSTNTKPELMFRKELYSKGIRYRVNVKKLPGSPDIANVSKKLAVFIDGEFWHGHNWEVKKNKIKSNRGFWIPKIERNMQRDRENIVMLEEMGFKVFRFWETQVKKDLTKCVLLVCEYVDGQGGTPKIQNSKPEVDS